MFNKSLLKIKINKNEECIIKIDSSTYSKLNRNERIVLNTHIRQILEILKDKYLDKGENVWKE